MSVASKLRTGQLLQQGFTLVELMVVLAIVAILLLVATPNYDSLIIGSKVDKARYALASSLAFARTEAVKRGDDVTVCRGSSGTCGTGTGATSWNNNGWKVIAEGAIIRTTESDNAGVDIDYECGDFISFGADGEKSSGTNECEFSFADGGGDASYDKSLWINAVGRVRMQ
mgnify:CR=1 FL=1